jgi:ribosome-binding protein aMBF1 (putative translation factor)
MGWKQKDLAQRINVSPAIIQEYENGKATPDGGIISKLNRVRSRNYNY